jgi:hypothetical protein
MTKKHIKNDFIGGWFLGSFPKSLVPNFPAEVCVKYYKLGDYEPSHMHKIADEYTVIVKGEVLMNGVTYKEHDVITTAKGTSTDFRVLSDEAITCVVKYPGVLNDKYVI